MKNEKIKITKLLLYNKHVNNYSKLMIILSNLYYFQDYYIPNRKLMNMLHIRKHRLIGLLHQMVEDKIIVIFYKGRKRYFNFAKYDIDPIRETKNVKEEDYNWLEDDEEYEYEEPIIIRSDK